MRIALFTETYLPYLNGVVTHIQLLAKSFEELGHEVMIVTVSDVEKPVIDGNILRCPGVDMKKIYNYRLAGPVSIPRTKLVEEFNPDVIHVHNEFGIGFSGLQIARKLKVPAVYTLHSDYDSYLYYISLSVPFLDQAVKKGLESYLKYFVKYSTMVLSPSPKAETYLNRVQAPKEVHVLPNAVDVEKFRPPFIDESRRAEFRKEQGMSEDTAAFVFVGRLGNEKQIDDLLHFFKNLNRTPDEARLFIYGKGPAEEELRRLIETLEIGEKAKLMGALPNTEVPTMLSCMDYYITASQTEMHSISMLEGQAAGLPVLMRSDPPNDWQIEEGQNGFIWRNREELKALVDKLLAQSPEERKALHETVKTWSDNNGRMKQAEKLLDYYRQAIDLLKNS